MYGAYLLREIKKRRTGTPLLAEAIGGRQLMDAGANMVALSSRWGAMGIVESVRVFPRIIRSFVKARKVMRIGDPGLFVPIDFGFMNVRLCKFARDAEWKVLYFMPPGSWRRRSQGEGLAELTDEIVTPFPWSSAILGAHGARVHWYGHPLKQIVAESGLESSGDTSTTIAVLPGSREHEVSLNMSVIAKSMEKLSRFLSLEFAVASSIKPSRVRELWQKHYSGDRKVTFVENDTLGVLMRARAAIVCSGTATLQAALCGCPMVVIYRLSKMMELEARILRLRPEYISLPNIVANRRLVPELIQQKATAKNIAMELLPLVDNGPERESQMKGFIHVSHELGDWEAITDTATLALKMAVGM